ncbi:hypothetical protein XI09_16185 [Bradyrhizobium sp. CCBAU 11386]|nr:hypothetical protein [Bradyrhizobium sp. CCBAU 11386]MDA9506143.1 hypothetical protein [Bradyrhizobium sp. CCBAU 11386]
MGKISKKGDAYLRKLLVLGTTTVIRYCRDKHELTGWINAHLQRRPTRFDGRSRQGQSNW